jgi:hypothetical protein
VRFIAKNAKLCVVLEGPATDETPPVLLGQFAPAVQCGGLEPSEVDAALGRWPQELSIARGTQDEYGAAERRSLEQVVGVLDTDDPRHGWNEETRASVEERLLRNEGCGRDYLPVTATATPPMPPPWPSYPTIQGRGAARKIAELAEAMGYDPASVIAYERRAGNRPDVIAALEKLAVAA